MTIDEHLAELRMTAADFGRAVGIAPRHAWKLRTRAIQPSLALADQIVKWSGGRVKICDMIITDRNKETAA